MGSVLAHLPLVLDGVTEAVPENTPALEGNGNPERLGIGTKFSKSSLACHSQRSLAVTDRLAFRQGAPRNTLAESAIFFNGACIPIRTFSCLSRERQNSYASRLLPSALAVRPSLSAFANN